MDTTILVNDIKVIYVTAASFPDGVLDAHKKLHSMIPFYTDRKYFGISRPENGKNTIIYRAAAEELHPGEAEGLKCETLILKKEKYATITINDFMKDVTGIQKAFQKLLSYPELDPQGYCVEWYINDTDVKCMIRLSR
jgi:hypothetical protein